MASVKFTILILLFIQLSGCKALFKNPLDRDSSPSDTLISNELNSRAISKSVVEKISELPKCEEDLNPKVIYVVDVASFYICNDEKWAALEMKGEKGDPGPSISDLWRQVWKTNIGSAAYIEAKYDSAQCYQYESGSGFVVESGVVATNGHVAPESITQSGCGTMTLQEIRVWYPEDAKGDTQHKDLDDDGVATHVDWRLKSTHDTILLKVDTGDRKPMVIETSGEATNHIDGDGVKVAQEVLQFGYSGASTYVHFATGRITGIQPAKSGGFLSSLISSGLIEDGRIIYEYDLVSGAGSSGGALLSLDGKVIGINFAGNTESSDTEFGYAVTVEGLQLLLSEPKQWQTFGAP